MRRLAMILALAAFPAQAQAAGGQTCTISATPLAFGAYTPMGSTPSDFTATLTVDCVATAANAVAVRATIALTGGGRGRRLNSGGRNLRYQLYSDPGRSTPWGDGRGTVSLSGFVSQTTRFHQIVTVYGRLLAHQTDAKVGNYTDLVTAVLTY